LSGSLKPEDIMDATPEPVINSIAVGEPNPNPSTLVEGDDNTNILCGTGGFDLIYGFAGDDILVGNGGRDYLDGGDGNDILTGGPDAEPHVSDNFSFDQHDGYDIITDFDPSGPLADPSYRPDTIGLKDASSLNDIDSIVATVTETPLGDAVLHYGETTIVLLGVAGVEIIPEIFRFG